jgi:hypothetical protein
VAERGAFLAFKVEINGGWSDRTSALSTGKKRTRKTARIAAKAAYRTFSYYGPLAKKERKEGGGDLRVSITI